MKNKFMLQIQGLNAENCTVLDINNNFNQPTDFTDFIDLNYDNNNIIIIIKDNIIIEKPIYLINHSTRDLNIIINSGNNSQCTIIDHRQNENNITKIICNNNSITDYYLIQSTDNSQINIQQKFNSKFNAKLLADNYSNNKLQLEINLLEPNANIELNILQNTKQQSNQYINLLINHLTTNSSSYTLARSTAHDQSNAELIGKIIVHKSSAKTHANLQSKSLLLSKQASITSCPELLIDNNDVVCSHGSSVGNLDANALFYMQSRGISLEDATQILLQAFLQPVLQKIKYQQIIDYLSQS